MYLVITDGSTTITIADGSGGATNYVLSRGTWSPQIAGLRPSSLSGRGPYNDVVEEMQLNITGSTPAAAMTNLSTLTALLEQADRWYKGENVSPVLIKYSPDGATVSSSGSPLQAAILGRAPGDQSALRLSPNFDDTGSQGWVLDVTIRFWRRGLWLHTTDAASSSSTTNGDAASISMAGAITYKSPTKIALTNFGHGKSSGEWYQGGFVLVAESSSDIEIINPEGTLLGDWTSVSGSANSARNTDVIRYTPTTTTEGTMVLGTTPSISSAADIVGVFANIKNSTTVDFKLRIRLGSNISGLVYTPWINIDASSTQFQKWVFCGTVPKSGAATAISVGAIADSASSSFEIDTIVLVDMRKVATIEIDGPTFSDSATLLSTVLGTLTIDHNLLELPQPDAVVSSRKLTALGNAIISTNSATLTCLLLATGSGDSATGLRWRQYDGGAVLANTWTATRYTGYLTPV